MRDTVERQPDVPGKLFVNGLHPNVTEKDLRRNFAEVGDIEEVLLKKDPTTFISKGFAFISYADPNNAKIAKSKLSGRVIAGRKITVDFAMKALTGQLKDKGMSDHRFGEVGGRGRGRGEGRGGFGRGRGEGRGAPMGGMHGRGGFRGGRDSPNGVRRFPPRRDPYDDDFYDDPYADPYGPIRRRDPYDDPYEMDPYEMDLYERDPYRDPYDFPPRPRHNPYDLPPPRRHDPYDLPPPHRDPYAPIPRKDPYADLDPYDDLLAAAASKETFDYGHTDNKAAPRRPADPYSTPAQRPDPYGMPAYKDEPLARGSHEGGSMLPRRTSSFTESQPGPDPYGTPRRRPPPAGDDYFDSARPIPSKDPYGGTAPSPYGESAAPSPYGARAAPSPYGASAAPSPYGASAAPSLYGASAAPSPYGASAEPSPYGANAEPSPYGASAAPSPYGASAAPSPYGASAVPSPYGERPARGQPSLLPQAPERDPYRAPERDPYRAGHPVQSRGAFDESPAKPRGALLPTDPYSRPSPRDMYGASSGTQLKRGFSEDPLSFVDFGGGAAETMFAHGSRDPYGMGPEPNKRPRDSNTGMPRRGALLNAPSGRGRGGSPQGRQMQYF